MGGFQSASGMRRVQKVALLEPAAAGSAGSRKSEIAIATGRLRLANRKGKRLHYGRGSPFAQGLTSGQLRTRVYRQDIGTSGIRFGPDELDALHEAGNRLLEGRQ